MDSINKRNEQLAPEHKELNVFFTLPEAGTHRWAPFTCELHLDSPMEQSSTLAPCLPEGLSSSIMPVCPLSLRLLRQL
jgi:hypothetical protein